MSEKDTGAGFDIGFVIGATMGLAMGFLYAPRPGKETRELWKGKAEEVKEKVEEVPAEKLAEDEECYCPYCEGPLEELEDFCGSCNLELEDCPECGKAKKKGEEGCPHCAATKPRV